MDKEVQEQQAEQPVEVETTEVESPTTEEEQTPVSDDQVEQPDTETESSDEDDVPEFADEAQAKAFQKQRQEIKRLREELEKRGKTESALSQLNKPQPGVAQDATTQQRVMQFELEKTKTLMRYPELDPDSDQYDPQVEERFAKEWTFSQVTGTGMSLLDAAKKVLSGTSKEVKKAVKAAKEEAAQETKESITLKERSTAIAPTKSGGNRTTSADIESLRLRTRLGDKNAFVERLARAEGK